MANRLSGFLVVGLSLGLAACGGDNLTLPSEGEPAAIAVREGNTQIGRVGTELGLPLIVQVTDTRNRPVAGATVEFVFTDGAGTAAPASSTTDGDGRASSRLTLGSLVGPVNGVVRVPVPAGRVPVQATFTATAVPSDAAGIALVSGDNQTGPVGAPLALPLVVKVTDGFNNPISGFAIQWAVGSGEGGTVSESSTSTNDQGLSSVTRTLGGSAGNQTTIATATGPVAGSPVIFRHVANAGSASSVVKIAGDVGSAPAGSPVDLVVEVRDAGGNPVPSTSVTWALGEGGGSVDPTSNTTNAAGRASARWTLGSTPGTNTLTAVSNGATATFTITGTGTGSASRLAITTQPPASTELGAVLNPAPVVQIRDNNGNNVSAPGVDVTVSLESAGSARLDGDRTVTTDANGRAVFSDLRINAATGSRRLIFAAAEFSGTRSDRIDVNKASTTTTITSDEPDPSDPNEPVLVEFRVDWPASAGTPTGRVDVAVTDGGGADCNGPIDASGNGSCVLTDLMGTGQRTMAATYRGDDLFAGSTSAEVTHTVNEPPPTDETPTAVDDPFYTTSQDTPLVIPTSGPLLIANDIPNDSDDLYVTPVAGQLTSQGGTVTIGDNGSFTYTPPPGFTGTDTFDYTLTDRPPPQAGKTDVGTATVTIN